MGCDAVVKKTWNFPWQWFLIQFHLLLKVPIITSAPAVSWTSSSSYIFMSFPWKTISFFFRLFPFLPQCQVQQQQQPNCSSSCGAGRERIRRDTRWWLLYYYYPQLVNVWGPLLPHLFQPKKKRKISSSSFRFYSRTSIAPVRSPVAPSDMPHTQGPCINIAARTHTHMAHVYLFQLFFFSRGCCCCFVFSSDSPAAIFSLSSRLIAIYIHLIRSVCSRSTFYFIFLQVIQQVNFG